MNSSTTKGPVTTALLVLAGGRIALGAGAIAAPGALARMFGARPTPEIDYLARVYGARAIALGAAYVLAGPENEVGCNACVWGWTCPTPSPDSPEPAGTVHRREAAWHAPSRSPGRMPPSARFASSLISGANPPRIGT